MNCLPTVNFNIIQVLLVSILAASPNTRQSQYPPIYAYTRVPRADIPSFPDTYRYGGIHLRSSLPCLLQVTKAKCVLSELPDCSQHNENCATPEDAAFVKRAAYPAAFIQSRVPPFVAQAVSSTELDCVAINEQPGIGAVFSSWPPCKCNLGRIGSSTAPQRLFLDDFELFCCGTDDAEYNIHNQNVERSLF